MFRIICLRRVVRNKAARLHNPLCSAWGGLPLSTQSQDFNTSSDGLQAVPSIFLAGIRSQKWSKITTAERVNCNDSVRGPRRIGRIKKRRIKQESFYIIRAFWSASWPKRRFKSQFCCGFLLPASVAERCAPSKAVAERLEFGFHPVDTASPLSGFQNRAVAEQSIGTAPSGWFQTGPLPLLASLNHLRPQKS